VILVLWQHISVSLLGKYIREYHTKSALEETVLEDNADSDAIGSDGEGVEDCFESVVQQAEGTFKAKVDRSAMPLSELLKHAVSVAEGEAAGGEKKKKKKKKITKHASKGKRRRDWFGCDGSLSDDSHSDFASFKANKRPRHTKRARVTSVNALHVAADGDVASDGDATEKEITSLPKAEGDAAAVPPHGSFGRGRVKLTHQELAARERTDFAKADEGSVYVGDQWTNQLRCLRRFADRAK